MKKIKSLLLTVLLIIVSLSGLTTVCQALDTDDTIYPGDKVIVTYSFAKDIPAGCEYYYFTTNYPLEMVKYSGFKNHWALRPWIDETTIYYNKVVPVSGVMTNGSHYGPQVKAGQKIVSIIYEVIKKANVSDLNFPLIKLKLGINNQYEYLRDLSYLSYDVAITSKGEKPTEPTTVAPTTTEPTTVEPTEAPTTVAPTTVEPTTVAPTTTEPTTVEPTTVEPTTVTPETTEPTTVKPTEVPTTVEPTTVAPETVEPTTAEPTTVEPTEAPTTVPTTTQPTTTEQTEEPIATNPATVPTVSQPSTSADSTTATDSSTVASVTSDVTNTETTISANPSASGKSDSTNDEVNSNTNNSQNGNQNDNGVVKTGVPSMSMIVLVIMISSLAVIYFVRKRVK